MNEIFVYIIKTIYFIFFLIINIYLLFFIKSQVKKFVCDVYFFFNPQKGVIYFQKRSESTQKAIKHLIEELKRKEDE